MILGVAVEQNTDVCARAPRSAHVSARVCVCVRCAPQQAASPALFVERQSPSGAVVHRTESSVRWTFAQPVLGSAPYFKISSGFR